MGQVVKSDLGPFFPARILVRVLDDLEPSQKYRAPIYYIFYGTGSKIGSRTFFFSAPLYLPCTVQRTTFKLIEICRSVFLRVLDLKSLMGDRVTRVKSHPTLEDAGWPVPKCIRKFWPMRWFFKRKKALERWRGELSNGFRILKNGYNGRKLWSIEVC